MFEPFSTRISGGVDVAAARAIPMRRPRAARRRRSSPRIEGLEARINLTAATQLAIMPATITTTYGDQASFTAQVTSDSGTPTGTVDFYNGSPAAGGQLIGNGIPVDGSGDASFQISTLPVTPAGTPDQIYAIYEPLNSGEYSSSTTTTPSSLTITPASLTITANDVSMTYADGTTLDGTTGFTASGLVNGDSVSSVTLTTDATTSGSGNWDAGSWSITPGAAQGSGLTNYNITYDDGTLTVSPEVLGITGITAQDKTYDGTDAATVDASAASIQSGQLVAGDDVSLDTAITAGSFASTAVGNGVSITVLGLLTGADAGNYTPEFTLSADITPASLTITANDVGMTYADGTTLDGATGFTTSGLVGGDSVSSVTLATDAPLSGSGNWDAGSWSITPGDAQGSGLSNYDITYDDGTLTVSPKALPVTGITAQDKTYDGTTTATIDTSSAAIQPVSGDDVSLDAAGAAGSFAGADAGTGVSVTITGLALTGADAGNYTPTTDVTADITPASLTVTAKNVNATYGDGTNLNGATGFTTSGLVGDDSVYSVSLATNATRSGSGNWDAGTWSITPSDAQGSGLANYNITYDDGTLTVSPKALTVTADAQTMTYGAAVPNLTYSANGFVTGDTPSMALTGSLATSATSGSHVGHYDITQGTLAAVDGNYTITFQGANLSVTPASLTIAVNNASKVYGAPLPSFSLAYSGFVNGDSAASLATAPVVSTTATATSAAGVYGLNASGASSPDYTISYVSGNLVITKANSSAALNGSISTAVVGQTATYTVQVAPVSPGAGQPTGTVTFLLDGTPIGTVAVDPTTGQASLSTTSIARGTHVVTASYSGDPDFQSSQSASSQIVVSPAGTQSVLTTQAVRNKKGKIVSVNLLSQVLVASPGSGVPGGVVTFYRKAHKVKTIALSGGRATLNLKQKQAMNKSFTVQYSGSGDFTGSTSAPIKVTRAALKSTARPALARSGHGS